MRKGNSQGSHEQISKNKKGYTLVELIVSFALIGIFMSAASVMLSGAIRVQARMNNLSKVQQVADTVMETIIGEVSAAEDGWVEVEEVDSEFDKLSFTDKNGHQVALCVGDSSVPETEGLLKLEYDTQDESGDPIVWYYGKEVYMYHYISKLHFTDAGSSASGKTLIRVELQFKNASTGYEFDLNRMIECYNPLSEEL